MIKKGTKVSWKVDGFPDASGIAIEDEKDGRVLIDDSEPNEEGSLILQQVILLTIVDEVPS